MIAKIQPKYIIWHPTDSLKYVDGFYIAEHFIIDSHIEYIILVPCVCLSVRLYVSGLFPHISKTIQDDLKIPMTYVWYGWGLG